MNLRTLPTPDCSQSEDNQGWFFLWIRYGMTMPSRPQEQNDDGHLTIVMGTVEV